MWCSLAALVPSLVGALWRLEQGLAVVEARDDLDHTAHYLWSVLGEVPGPRGGTRHRTYLVAAIDHGFNASTFTGRVVASTGAPELSWPRSRAVGTAGGAPSRALDAVDEIGEPARARQWVADTLGRGRRSGLRSRRLLRPRSPVRSVARCRPPPRR